MMILRNMLLVAVALVSAALLAASQEADGILRADGPWEMEQASNPGVWNNWGGTLKRLVISLVFLVFL